ncbi:hypothetical protein FZC83_01810 [Rossellomorea marisflavi]|uniref:Uncharacterized protein n=1 Tax=Rossellomorea marisflavi TaxID=189381 RepID=A0A5D4S185_9BACI|nr:hypothetical protein [Rossellomorea marisflavi]TYS56331.1 hypothetical protein FZC83_01810 [Rossellomorea marisflavi]
MSEQICYKCEGLIDPMNVHIIALKHNKETFELAAHRNCADEIENKLKEVKNLNKLNIQDTLKIINE